MTEIIVEAQTLEQALRRARAQVLDARESGRGEEKCWEMRFRVLAVDVPGPAQVACDEADPEDLTFFFSVEILD